MRYVDEYAIRDQANELVVMLEEVERALTDFQIDLDTNKFMSDELKWDYDDLAKSVSDAVFNARALYEDADEAAESEDEEDEEEEDQ